MDKGRGYRDQFYQEQNIDLRKQLRELDFRLAQGESNINQCIFLVVGPPKTGKTSLLRTLQFALNGSQGWGMSKKGALSAIQIKKGSRWQIEGMKQLKQVNQKYSIVGMQLSSDQKPCMKYKRALDYMQANMSSCTQEDYVITSNKARVCLIVLDSKAEVPHDEMTYLKFLRMEMSQKGLKSIIILKGTFNRQGDEWRKIELKIAQLQHAFQIKRDDIFCMDTIMFEQQSKQAGRIILKQSQLTNNKVENHEETNFYALQLLLKVVKQSQKTLKSRVNRLKGWLCGWV